MPATLSVWDLLWTLLGILGIWAVASIPAYALLTIWFLLRAAIERAIAAFADFISAVFSAHALNAVRTGQDLRARSRWYEVDATARGAWLETIDKISADARSNAALSDEAVKTSRDSVKELAPLAKRLRGLALATETLPTIPAGQQLVDSMIKSRVSAVNFVATSFGLLAVVSVNAQMTGLVLSEIIPPLQPLLGVPVPFLLAGGLVIVEFVIGLLHSIEAESREGTERSVSILGLLYSIAAIAIVIFEGMLYGQVDAGSVLSLPIGGSAFALIGGILGIAVFGLGRVWHSSLITIRKSRTPKVVRKELELLRDAAEEWNAVADRVRPQQETAATAFERLVDLCKQGSEIQLQTVRALDVEIKKHRIDIPAWATPKERTLSDAEFGERVSRSYLWLLVWIASSLIAGALSESFSIWLSPLTGFATGLVVAFAAFALGLVGTQLAIKKASLRVAVQVALAIGALVIAALEGRFLRGRLSWHVTALAAATVAAYLAGHKIGPEVALLQLPLLSIVRAIKATVLYPLFVLAKLIGVITLLIEYVIRFAAWPVWILVETFSARKPSLRAAA